MKRALPPLPALRAFDAAARCMSFTLASQELHVTQSAVSRQIRILEDYLQRKLFVRLTRKIALTEEGQAYFQAIRHAFENIEAASAVAAARPARSVLSIGVLPGIASLWLMPRLTAFWQANKDIDVRIISSIEPADFKAQGIDMAIKVGALPGKHYEDRQPRMDGEMTRAWRGVRCDMLFPDVLVPVCHRRLLEHAPLNDLADLRRHRLIHTAIRRNAWQDWLGAHGSNVDPLNNAIDFGQYFMSLQAAREGQGVALVPSVLIDGFDLNGELLRPFPATLASRGEYYLLTPQERCEERKLRRFREWILVQALAGP